MLTVFSFNSRLKALLTVCIAIGSVLVLLNVSVDFLTRSVPPWVDTIRREPQPWLSKKTELCERLAGLVRQRASEPVGSRTSIGVILGFSAVARGFDVDQLESADPTDRRWVNLGTGGTGFFWMHQEAKMLLSSGLKPDKVVLGLHPAYLVGRRPYFRPASSTADIVRAAVLLQPGACRHSISQLCWTTRERLIVRTAIDNMLFNTRRRILSGQPFENVWAAAVDPWQAELSPKKSQESQSFIDEQLYHLERMGWFDSSRYNDVSEEAEFLVDTIHRLRDSGSEVTIVLMPESAILQQRVPEIAETKLVRLLRKAFPEKPPQIVNLRRAFDDTALRDNTHPNPLGRDLITGRLAENLVQDSGIGTRNLKL